MSEEKKPHTPQEEPNRRKMLGSLLSESNTASEEHSLGELLKSLNLGWPWFIRTFLPLFALVVAGYLLVITCRYQTQQDIIEREQMEAERDKWHDLMLTRQSELTEKQRQSRIEGLLRQHGDSVLAPSLETPYTITIQVPKK